MYGFSNNFFFIQDNTKYEALIDQLDKYSKQGIPSNINYRQGQCESLDALYNLEDDWRDIINFSGKALEMALYFERLIYITKIEINNELK